jgi:hypothetical protein
LAYHARTARSCKKKSMTATLIRPNPTTVSCQTQCTPTEPATHAKNARRCTPPDNSKLRLSPAQNIGILQVFARQTVVRRIFHDNARSVDRDPPVPIQTSATTCFVLLSAVNRSSRRARKSELSSRFKKALVAVPQTINSWLLDERSFPDRACQARLGFGGRPAMARRASNSKIASSILELPRTTRPPRPRRAANSRPARPRGS